MKPKHFFVALFALVITTFCFNSTEAHPHHHFRHCNPARYYGYRFMPPPPPPAYYYAPRHFHHHVNYYRGYRQCH